MEPTLFVGDVHATPDSLEECWRLIEFVAETAEIHQVRRVVFLGDQYHNHALVHLEVMRFWMKAFEKLRLDHGLKVWALVGNHDRPGDASSDAHAMAPHQQHIIVAGHGGRGVALGNGVHDHLILLGYFHDPEKFLEAAQKHHYIPTIVCHQTFVGALFENNWPAPDGIDQNLVPQKTIISGHIHTPQTLGKVWYPGSPRWRTVGDANQDRGIWVVRFNEDGTIADREMFSTKNVCKPIYQLEDRPGAPAEVPDHGAIVVDVYGPTAYVLQRKAELEQRGIRVRGFAEDRQAVKVRESEGIKVAFDKYLASFEARGGTSAEVLMGMARERISWLKTV